MGVIHCGFPRKCHIWGFSTWRMQLGGFAVSVSNSFETQSDFEEGTTYPWVKTKLEMSLTGTRSWISAPQPVSKDQTSVLDPFCLFSATLLSVARSSGTSSWFGPGSPGSCPRPFAPTLSSPWKNLCLTVHGTQLIVQKSSPQRELSPTIGST